MGFLDKLFGRDEAPPAHAPLSTSDAPPRCRSTPALSEDEQAGARYLYLLKTAPPEEIEKAHEEAFAKLSPEQRRQVLERLGQVVPPTEYSGLRDDPQSLARAATRAEMQQSGSLRRAFGGAGAGGGMGMGGMGMPGMGSMMMGGLFASLAGAFIGTSVAQAFFNNPSNEADYQQSPESSGETSDAGDGNDSGDEVDSFDANADGGYDSSYDASAGEVDAGFGGDFDGGDFGGDFGGGDF